jgi:hypothetical protein
MSTAISRTNKCQYPGGEDGPRRGEAFFAPGRRPCGIQHWLDPNKHDPGAGKQQVSRGWPGGRRSCQECDPAPTGYNVRSPRSCASLVISVPCWRAGCATPPAPGETLSATPIGKRSFTCNLANRSPVRRSRRFRRVRRGDLRDTGAPVAGRNDRVLRSAAKRWRHGVLCACSTVSGHGLVRLIGPNRHHVAWNRTIIDDPVWCCPSRMALLASPPRNCPLRRVCHSYPSLVGAGV